MEDKYKNCVKCTSRMNVLDTHEECYRHRICHKAFPCNICREWDDEKRSLVDKMLEKARSKLSLSSSAVNPSVQEAGNKLETAKLSELASPAKHDKLSKVRTDHRADDRETQGTGVHFEAVEFNKFIADQVQMQLKKLLPQQGLIASDAMHASIDSKCEISESQSLSRPRAHYSKFMPSDDQISVVSHEIEDEISMGGSAISDENNNDAHSQSQHSHEKDFSLFSEGAPGSTDPVQWNNFLHKLTTKLKIDCSEETEVDSVRTSYLPSRLNPGNSNKSTNLKLPLEGTTVEVFKNVEKEAMSGRLKNRSVRLRDDKAFMVSKKDFTEFCSPPRLDDNIEEGLSSTMGNKKKGFVDRKKFSHSLPSFHKEMDAEFKKVDNSARTLLRSVSYGSLIASYIDVADSEEDRVEACSALVACFKSMADMTSRIVANSVINRRKIFLKNVDFTSKATSAKLLNLPLNGAQLFGGKYFDTLHSSAENIRDAKETQNVYRSSFVPGGQKFDEGSRKRKSQETSNVSYNKPAKTSRYDKQDFNDRRGTDTSSNFRALPAKQGGKGSFLWKNSSQKNFKK